jgi:hypothetical protein
MAPAINNPKSVLFWDRFLYIPAMAKCMIKKFMRVFRPLSDRLMAINTQQLPRTMVINRGTRNDSWRI